MTPRYLRTPPQRRDQAVSGLVAAAVGAGVALVTFYFVRLLLSREPLEGDSAGRVEARTPEA